MGAGEGWGGCWGPNPNVGFPKGACWGPAGVIGVVPGWSFWLKEKLPEGFSAEEPNPGGLPELKYKPFFQILFFIKQAGVVPTAHAHFP